MGRVGALLRKGIKSSGSIMETNPNYTIVGIFVIALFSVIILTIIWLSSGLSSQSYSIYEVFMPESVSGLSIDAPVEYNGVNVGTVKSIEINRKVPRIVQLLLKIKSNTPITMGTRATLNARVLTGVAFIALKDQGTDMTPLVAVPGQPYPVIESAPSFFLQLDKALTKLNNSFHEISVSIRALLDEQNLRSIKDTLANISVITHTLAGDSAKIDQILQNTAKATLELGPLLKSSRSSIQLLQTQMLPAANQAIVNMNTLMSNLSRASKDIKDNPSVLIRGKERPSLGPGEN